MKLTILNFTTGHIHIHNVSSQSEVISYVDKHSEKTWMLSNDKEFKIINH
jgi:hypothetical protein